jgi:hypothetical protein
LRDGLVFIEFRLPIVCDSGGTIPVTGFHSTMDRPDCVSRVAPPTTTMANTRAARHPIHSRIKRTRASLAGSGICMIVSALVRPMRDPIDLGKAGSNTCNRCARSMPRCRAPGAGSNPRGASHPTAHSHDRNHRTAGAGGRGRCSPAARPIVLVRTNGLLDLPITVAGLGWVLTAMPLISWMSRGDEPGRKS